VRRTLPPSAEIEAQIDKLLAVGMGKDRRGELSKLAKLGARLIIQRAVADEFDAWLGLSMRDVESLCEEAGLGKLSKSTASRICGELRERFEQFKRRDLYEVKLVALFLDAIYLAVRPQGPKEGVLCAWGFTEEGERVLVSVMLGMRESHEDWLELGRDLIARGLPGADAGRLRRRPRADQRGRAVLAAL